MSQTCSRLRTPLHLTKFVLALMAAAGALVGNESHAGPPNEAAVETSQPVVKQASHSVLLSDEDWRQVPLKPLASSEIDAIVGKELRAIEIEPTLQTTDEQFIRRVFLDVTGQLPQPAQVTEFVAPAPHRPPQFLIRESAAYARHGPILAMCIRPNYHPPQGAHPRLEEWLFEQFRAGSSWAEITRAIITAKGELRFTLNTPLPDNGELFFLVAHDNDEAEERAAETSRVFLGIQIQCAQCHDHPTEPWKREQFHELAAYFSRIKYEQLFDDKKLVGVQLVTLPDREHKMTSLEDPDSSPVTHPRFLDGQNARRNLSDDHAAGSSWPMSWSTKNHWFAAAYVNRMWSELMGWSFYPHVDDIGPTKHVIFPEVLTRLTGAFRGTDYDIKALFRTFANSETYQRQIRPEERPTNALHFAAAVPDPLAADVLWDSLVHVLGKIEHGYAVPHQRRQSFQFQLPRRPVQSRVRFRSVARSGRSRGDHSANADVDEQSHHQQADHGDQDQPIGQDLAELP